MPFEIEFTPDAWEHLQQFTARDRNLILDEIEVQLQYEPNLETRNRKPLRDKSIATWELRIGKFRVFYDIENHKIKIVTIVAIGYKDHNQLFIGGKLIDL
ncbi:MAG: type II toxin-antitoxin system RelE/ParE family toxin [Symploca sp. SIO3E6]|nr:type II toxin-antitoxin system RelE/ParE family toxin [Caldora sp. SIO3E6]